MLTLINANRMLPPIAPIGLDYVAPALGPRPARLIRGLIGGDPRFFEPADDAEPTRTDGSSSAYNYSANQPLSDAIAHGARGAYWDILRRGRLNQ